MTIHEILSESEWSENEDIQASIITFLTDKFNITEEEPDGNCLFRALIVDALDHLNSTER